MSKTMEAPPLVDLVAERRQDAALVAHLARILIGGTSADSERELANARAAIDRAIDAQVIAHDEAAYSVAIADARWMLAYAICGTSAYEFSI